QLRRGRGDATAGELAALLCLLLGANGLFRSCVSGPAPSASHARRWTLGGARVNRPGPSRDLPQDVAWNADGHDLAWRSWPCRVSWQRDGCRGVLLSSAHVDVV